MVDLGRGHTDNLLANSQLEGLRNMLGGARAIFVSPDFNTASFLVGVDSGTGFLMCRHGDDWSDPVFYTLTQTNAGEQIALTNSHLFVILLTDTAVDNFRKGSIQIGGSGGITVGTYGLSVSGAGGLEGGLEMLLISTNQGLSFGGSVGTIWAQPNKALNIQAYGPNVDINKILSKPGGQFAPARVFRLHLKQMVRHAWGVQ
jgi:lipid-binding SYLF domain-containing protein